MKKVCNKWKVFLIVLCMLFTMFPTAVIAAEPLDLTTIETPTDPPTTPVVPPADPPTTTVVPPADPGTTPNGGNSADPGTPPNSGNPADTEKTTTEVTNGGIEVPDVQRLTMTPMCCLANLTINKIVKGNPPKAEVFKFKIKAEDGLEFEKTITGSGSKNIPLLVGTYTITEVESADYVADITSKTVCLSLNNQSETVTFTNTYQPTTITITKVINGDKPDPGSLPTFNFKIYKQKNNGDYKFLKNESITGQGSTVPFKVEPGTYKIEEIDDQTDDYTPVETEDIFTIAKNEAYASIFTNTYKDPTPSTTGSIKIIKDIQGDEPPESPDRFSFVISSGDYSDTIYISGEDFQTISNLTPGAYTITETNIPNHYTVSGGSITVNVAASDTPQVATIINIYDMPDPEAYVTKKVAVYDGVNIPADSEFVERLNLSDLNKTVIYKIVLSANDKWIQYEKAARLFDSYDGESIPDITNELLVLDNGKLEKAIDVLDTDYPGYLYFNSETDRTFYYIDTLAVNGTYTNTAYLYEAILYRTMEGNVPIASSSAVVVVNYTTSSGGGGGGGGGGSHHYYDVTYHANYPVSVDPAGTVPTDSMNYSYNNLVTIKGNTGDLKAGNYIFDGWNTKPDGTGTAYKPSDTFNIKEDTILYAQWRLADTNTVSDADTSVDNDSTGVVDDSNVTAISDGQLDDVPKTGDTSPIMPMLLLGLLSLAGIAFSSRKKSGEPEVK